MAVVKTDNAHYAAIAAKIREKTGGDATYKPNEMPSGVDAVFAAGQETGYKNGYAAGETTGHASGYADGHNAGYAEGETAGHTAGVLEGKQAEYDRFWDAFQNYGNRTSYENAFSGFGWTEETFKPKYDIVPIGSLYMGFRVSKIQVDLAAHLQRLGVRLNTSKVTNISYAFYGSSFTRIGDIDISSVKVASSAAYLFSSSALLETIDSIKFGTMTGSFNSVFLNAHSLKNVVFLGSIANGGLDLQWSTQLSKASITSLINALSETTSALSVTLSRTAVNAAFETSAGAKDGVSSAEWATLIATKPNWTISLV